MVGRVPRSTWLAVAGGCFIVATACGNESVNVLGPRDVSVEADSKDDASDVSIEGSIDVSIDVSIDESADAGPIDASIDAGSIDAPAEPPSPGDGDGATPTGCNLRGMECALPGECCSLACPLSDAQQRTCAESPICSGAGQECGSNGDCCAGSCLGPPGCRGVSVSIGACLPAGEPCPSDGACCSGVCDPGAGHRCKRLNECRVVGETCPTPEKCCSGKCESDDRGVLICKQAPTCTLGGKMCSSQAWDRCMIDSDCCTGVCNLSEGVHRCTAPTTSCKVECAYCTQDLDCCVGSRCRADGSGYSRCETIRDL
jgi:hypothetical protein